MNKEDIDAKLAGSLAAIKALAGSDEGRSLVSSLDGKTLEGVKKAAEGVKNGDSEAMRDILMLLKNSNEGNAILKRLSEITQK